MTMISPIRFQYSSKLIFPSLSWSSLAIRVLAAFLFSVACGGRGERKKTKMKI